MGQIVSDHHYIADMYSWATEKHTIARDPYRELSKDMDVL